MVAGILFVGGKLKSKSEQVDMHSRHFCTFFSHALLYENPLRHLYDAKVHVRSVRFYVLLLYKKVDPLEYYTVFHSMCCHLNIQFGWQRHTKTVLYVIVCRNVYAFDFYLSYGNDMYRTLLDI